MNRLLLVLMSGLFATQIAAASVVPDEWATSLELGAIATSGNTEGASVTGKFDAREEVGDWTRHVVVSGYFKEDAIAGDDGTKTHVRSAEQYFVSAKAAVRLHDKQEKLFMLATHAEDRFGAFSTYSSLTLGCNAQVYRSAHQSLEVDIGPGYFTGVRADGGDADGFIAHGSAALEWKLGPTAVFTQSLSVERGASNVRSVAEAALRTKISDTMQMKAAFSAHTDSEAGQARKNTDTQTSLTVVYSF